MATPAGWSAHGDRTVSPGPSRALLALVGGYVAAYAGWQLFGWGGPGAKELIGDVAFLPVYIGATAMAWSASRRCAGVPRLRSAWRLIAIGLAFYLLGILLQSYYEIFAGSKPFPSLADPAYLMCYPFALAGLLRFPRTGGSQSQRRRTLVDCATVAIAGGAVLWYVVLGPTTLVAGATLPQTLVSVGAPVGDLMLIVGLATVLLRRTVASSEIALRVLAAGLVFWVAADVVYSWMSLHSTYSGGDPVDALYMGALTLFLLGGAAQRRPAPADDVVKAMGTWRASWLPWSGVALAFVLLGFSLRHVAFVAAGGLFISAAAVVVLVALRQFLAQRELLSTHRELELAHEELAALATTDPVTMLPNHRALVTAINDELSRSRRQGLGFALVFFDVDHFKLFNDSVGHAAGDTALRELGEVAASCLRGMDTVGRWGGEEFVVVLPETGADEAMVVTQRLRAAIAAHKFSVTERPHLTGSFGVAIYPDDGLTRAQLIDAADQAMYVAKRLGRNQVFSAADPALAALGAVSHRPAAGEEDATSGPVEALALLLDERDASTGAHSAEVANLAGRLAVELGCDRSQLSAIRLAARLHDIGKVAVSDAILVKPGPLTEGEWVVMKQHPVVGAEVLGLIPALRSIAPLVRAHHERWDGTGYPDGLAAEDIPLAVRILSVADAWGAMVSERPYSRPMSEADALSEVIRCAGTHFDPRVVAALERILDSQTVTSRAGDAVVAVV
jgi:two-component system cell cycle response regulator